MGRNDKRMDIDKVNVSVEMNEKMLVRIALLGFF
mgnify:CR=1 FL=1